MSAYTKEYLFDMDISAIDWPSRSPEINPDESLLPILGREVYKQGRQFESIEDLKEALLLCRDAIWINVLRNIINSMPNRLTACIEARGGFSAY